MSNYTLRIEEFLVQAAVGSIGRLTSAQLALRARLIRRCLPHKYVFESVIKQRTHNGIVSYTLRVHRRVK